MTKLLAIATLLFMGINPAWHDLSTINSCNGTARIDFSGEHTYYCSINGVIRWAVAYDQATKQMVVVNTATDRIWKFPVPYGSTERDNSSNKYNVVSFALTPGPANNGWLTIAFSGQE